MTEQLATAEAADFTAQVAVRCAGESTKKIWAAFIAK